MSEVSGPSSVEVGAFTVTSNITPAEEMSAALKPKSDKAASDAASQLGKRGAEARAEAKAKAEEAPEAEEKAEKRPIRPIPPKAEAKAPKPAPEGDQSSDETGEPEEKPAEEAKAEEPEEKKPNPRHDPKARMLEATRKEAEAKRALADERALRQQLEERIARLERGERPAPAPEPERPRGEDGKPTPDGYETYEEYLDARDAYNREQWEREISQRTQHEEVSRALDQAVGRFRDASAKVYDQISPEVGELRTEFQLAPGERATGANWLANELVFSPEQAPALMLYFTAHPDELQRIAALTNPRAVSREMAKLEARLEAATSGPSSRREDAVSTAAPPVKPVSGRPYVSSASEYREGMSLDEYRQVWKPHTRRR